MLQAQANLSTYSVTLLTGEIGDERFSGEPLVWSGGMKKLACVMSCLRLVCLDQNTTSLFVLCHCLR